jgi:hypothetical protein
MDLDRIAAGSERLTVAAASPSHDTAGVRTDFMVQRFDEDATRWAQRRLALPGNVTVSARLFRLLGIKSYHTSIDEDCNRILLGGWAAMLGGIAGTTITNKFSTTFGRIGAGTSTAAASATQTSLQGDTGSGSTTSYYQVCGTAPVIVTASTPATMTFTASFGGSVANFAWNEFATDNWNASGVTAQGLGANEVVINRGVSSQGSKATGQTWVATETISLGFPSGSGTVI